MDNICFLCGQVAEIIKQLNQDVYFIKCKICGEYFIDGLFRGSYFQMPAIQRALVSAFTDLYLKLARSLQ